MLEMLFGSVNNSLGMKNDVTEDIHLVYQAFEPSVKILALYVLFLSTDRVICQATLFFHYCV